MKRMISICMALVIVLSVASCKRQEAAVVTAETTLLTDATEEPVTTQANQLATVALNPADYREVFRKPEEIAVYPFTEDELRSAQTAAEMAAEQMKQEVGVLTFQAEHLAFDPMLTDIHVRQKIAASQNADWSERDYYSHYISFTLIYSAEYDHNATFLPDEDHSPVGIHLYRENSSAAWEIEGTGVPVAEYSGVILDAGERDALGSKGERILAAYGPQEGEYWLYLLNEKADVVIFETRKGSDSGPEVPEQTESEETEPEGTNPVQSLQETTEPTYYAPMPESVPQSGEPLQPQPGDTTSTWDAERAAEFPEDEECTDLELLEKWMTVEGLSGSDLDQNDCNQLILVVAGETDGVQTNTTCYERQADGSWAAVESLSGMHGHTGSNGICHNRKRNTNTTPAGLWALGTAFGNEKKPEGIRMPWRDITSDSDWVCDADSIYFNTWQERDNPMLTETWNYDDVEHLQDYVNSYAYACVIQYNTPPYTVADRGCAIFLHCSRGATGGCVGLSEPDMLNTLLWLDPDRNPHILITGHQNVDG